jgi:nicotinate-nucleotide adenylyltransferase
MQVGLFGGSFDPVHNGHLRVAEEVREHFHLERLYFIPAFAQPLKQRIKVTTAADRLKMVEIATRNNRFFHVSSIEMLRGGLSYSIETINAFATRYSDVHFLVGLDAFSEIEKWKSYRQIFERAHLIVLVRPMHRDVNQTELFPRDVKSDVRRIDEGTYEHVSGKKIFFHRVTQLDISSTMIRQLVHTGTSIKYLVPYVVERFISRGGLYKDK